MSARARWERLATWSALVVLGLAGAGCAQADPIAAHQLLRVRLGAAAAQPASGRLLVFAQPWDAAKARVKGGLVETVDNSEMSPKAVSVAAREVARITPGDAVEIDTDEIAFPAGFSHLPPGLYAVQAVLDVNHDYNYRGRSAGDLVSAVVQLRLPAAAEPTLSLDHAVPPRDPWTPSPRTSAADRAALEAARPNVQRVDVVSPALTAFWGRPVSMKAWVLTPPGYAAHPAERYPTVYWTHGFGGDIDRITSSAAAMNTAMASRQAPPMIWVFLDESSATGTHEFADGVNNGPWGTALTAELIPWLEARYRMDARAQGRLLNGHSSGGWATLWLQTRYPKLFGGTWSTSPDSSDFHDFTGPDIYAVNANVYRRADGTPWPLVRDKGRVLATSQEFAQLEEVLGPVGGQMASFEWVFSPRGPDGRPLKLFDRITGAVDPAVAAYWRDHYDIAHRLAADWPGLKPDLDGKIHLIVGTADTFYLDGAAHRLKAVLDSLGARSDIRFLPGKTHMDLYAEGGDPRALLKTIAREMYAVARPGGVTAR